MESTHLQRAQACLTHSNVTKTIDATQTIALAQAHALIDLAQTARAILAELQAQRLEPCVERVGDAEAIDPDLAAALGICPGDGEPCGFYCNMRRVCAIGQRRAQQLQAQRPATATGEWNPAVVAAGEGE